MMGIKSIIETLFSKKDKSELTNLLSQGDYTQREIANIFKEKGFKLSKSVVGRFNVALCKDTERITNAGVPSAISKVYKEDFEELAWLLLEREIIGQKSQENHHKIIALKEKLPFFKELEQ